MTLSALLARVLYTQTRRGKHIARLTRTGGRLERTSSESAGTLPVEYSRRSEWNAVPPNHGMELTGLKRHVLCKSEEQRPRRFSPAAHAKR